MQLLKGLCELSVQSARQTIRTDLSSSFTSNQLITSEIFEERIRSTVNRIKLNAPITLNRLMSLIRMKAHGDGIVSTYGTNYQYIIPANTSKLDSAAFTHPLTYDQNCSCALNFTCTINASFYQTELKTIQGLKMGCTPSESLLASTLECFSSSSCIDLLDKMVHYNRTNALSPLNVTGSRFAVDATVDDLVKELFVEKWSTEMSYSKYFDQCSPRVCSYTYFQQFNLIYTVTYILGLFGGLTIVLKWMCPRLVSLARKISQAFRKQRTAVDPVSNIEMTCTSINADPTPWTEPSLPWFYYITFYSIIVVIVMVLILVPFIYKYYSSPNSLAG